MKAYSNKVFIATSIDGYIADKDSGIEWLESIPELNLIDTGYAAFIAAVDALVMGRKTFETVCSFGITWPYVKPVYVVSNTLKEIPKLYKEKVVLVNGSLADILKGIHQNGHHHLYIDGGTLIQSFLKEDLIDEMVITIIPLLLGGGVPLFAELSTPINFECKEAKLFIESVVQNRFVRKKL